MQAEIKGDEKQLIVFGVALYRILTEIFSQELNLAYWPQPRTKILADFNLADGRVRSSHALYLLQRMRA